MKIGTRLWFGCAAAAFSVAVASGDVAAHHGWGNYDSAAAQDVTGVVETSTYENPHGEMRLRAEGKVWHVILAPPSRMQNRGLTPDMIKPGRSVTVHGYPHKSAAGEMRAERIIVDGKTTELR